MRRLSFVLVALALVWLANIVRHEGSHAVAAWAEGADIEEVRLLPGYRSDLGVFFGYVRWNGQTTWRTTAAPFPAAALMALLAFAWARKLGAGPWRSLLVLVGMVGPLADVAYNYQGGLWRDATDVHKLFVALPDLVVHGVLLAIIGAITGALVSLRTR